MLELAHPWALALIVLPLVMRLAPAYKESRDSVKVPFFNKLVELSEERPESGARILQRDRAQRDTAGRDGTGRDGGLWAAAVAAAAAGRQVVPLLGAK